MIKPFYFRVTSLTQLAAAKAALAQHGIKIGVEETAKHMLQTQGISIGNYYYRYNGGSKSIELDDDGANLSLWGGANGAKDIGASFFESLTALIDFLESGKYKAKKFKVALTKVEIVEVEAFTEDEAKARALQTKFPVIKTSTNVAIAE